MSFYIEESPNSRATCRICGGVIDKGQIRVFGDMGSGRFGYYYHLDCFLNRNKHFARDVVKYVLCRYINEETVSAILIALELKERG